MNSNKNSKDKKKVKKRRCNFCYDFVKITGAIPSLLWFRPRVHRLYKKLPRGAMMISSNHRSLLDPIIVHCAFIGRRLHSLATKDLYKTEGWVRFFNAMNCIMVDKANFSLSAFHDVVDTLHDGKAVVIFPEGQVNHEGDNSLLTFKSGAVLMAYKAGAPIVPIYIAPRKKWYHRQHVIVGEPIDLSTILSQRPTMQELNSASEYLREREMQLRSYFDTLQEKKHKKNKKDTEEQL